MRRAVLYARVSDEKQARDDRNSLPVQREKFIERCAARGYFAIGEPYVDVESGRRLTRKAYQRMLTAARLRQFDVVVVTFIDRFGRDQWETMRSLAELRSLDIEVDPTEEDLGAFVDDSQRFLMTAFKAWGANEESKKIGMRTKLASHRAVREGVAMGSTPYGFRKDRSSGKVRLVPDPDTAPIVRAIFAQYADHNMSFAQIKSDLNSRDVPSPRGATWSSESVRDIVSRTSYVGDVIWGETVVAGAHEAIVPRELWEAANRRRHVKAGLPRGWVQRSHYLLSGIIYCSYCGGRMEGNTSNIKGHTYRRYTCSRYRKTQVCTHRNQHDADKLEEAVVSNLGAELRKTDELRVRAEDELARLLDEFDHLEERLRDIPERFGRNMQLFERGTIVSEAQLALANQRLDQEERSLNGERSRLLAAIEDAKAFQVRVEDMPRSALELHDQIAGMDIGQTKALLQDLIERVECTEYSYDPRIVLR